MKSRLLSTLFAMLLMWGMLSTTVGYAFACSLTGDAMPTACPMRDMQTPPAPAVASSEPAPHSCCSNEPQGKVVSAAVPSVQNHCCCSFQTAADPEPSLVLAETSSLTFFAPTTVTVLVPPVGVALGVAIFAADTDAPRGPPRIALSPRAPPVFSYNA